MSKANPLGLLGQYGYSDDDSDEETMSKSSKMRTDLHCKGGAPGSSEIAQDSLDYSEPASVHPAPIAHCLWSACYDEGSGYTYYWNQKTNAVTWEPPPEYLLALKLAKQQLQTEGSAEVTAEEWNLYQQALSQKQSELTAQRPAPPKLTVTKLVNAKDKKDGPKGKKRLNSDSEDEKIELITSYQHSDSDSNDETQIPLKTPPPPLPPKEVPLQSNKVPKNPVKKQKTKQQSVEYGPVLPLNHNYTAPIGPELPEKLTAGTKPDSPKIEAKTDTSINVKLVEKEKKPDSTENTDTNDDIQDENVLLEKLRDKAKLLEKLGGELTSEIQTLIEDEHSSRGVSPDIRRDDTSKDSKTSAIDTNIDDLLEEIEKKELQKNKDKQKVSIDMFGDDVNFKTSDTSAAQSVDNSPKDERNTPPIEIKPLFPSSSAIVEEEIPKTLFPSMANVAQNGEKETEKTESVSNGTNEKKIGSNLYIMDKSEPIENTKRRKLRISNSVLPEKKKSDVPSYTTKYSQYIEGFSSERTGLGFNVNEDMDEKASTDSGKSAVAYGKGLLFTKGEVLIDQKRGENEAEKSAKDIANLLESKLKFLNEQQVYVVTPVQEMTIQMQTLSAAVSAGALAASYWRRWLDAGATSLARLEAAAAPTGWRCEFCREAGRYRYRREADGHMQWEYPAPTPPAPPAPPSDAPAPPDEAPAHDDMDICSTPPPPDLEEDAAPPPPPPPPPPLQPATPPPPPWADPPPPGCDDLSPPLTPIPALPPNIAKRPKQQEALGDELTSFYNDLAEMEKQSGEAEEGGHSPGDATPPLPAPPPPTLHRPLPRTPRAPPPPHIKSSVDAKDTGDTATKPAKKKAKVKISASVGLKHKSVSSLVAKWQQVAEEIHSD